MHKNIIYCSIIIIIFQITCYFIYNSFLPKEGLEIKKAEPIKETENISMIENTEQNVIIDELPIGKLVIPKINLKNKLYRIESEQNNIEHNVTILKGSIEPHNENSIMFIAAHSGTGRIAFFKDLKNVKLNDEIILEYDNATYKYIVNQIWETDKDGDIEISNVDKKQLVLTTCSQKHNNKQLIINSIIKES